MIKQKQAFTLAELTLALIVLSVIMIALAPVLTKRITDNIKVTNSTQSEFKLYTYENSKTDTNCAPASDGSKAYDCEFTSPPDAKMINIVLVGGGGGGAGAVQPITSQETDAPTSASTSSSTKEIEIKYGMKNFVVSYLSGGGGGGGGAAWGKTFKLTSQADCDPYNAKFLTAAQNGGRPACVAKYNIGDIPGATNGGIASGVAIVGVGTYCSSSSCCWKGQTAPTNECDSLNTVYSGCTRTVCAWQASNNSCSTLAYNGTKAGDWRLPTQIELTSWQSNISIINTGQGDNGIGLCEQFFGFNLARCFRYENGCPGSGNGRCAAYHIWSSTEFSGMYYAYHYDSGVFIGPAPHGPTYAFSARCVYDPKDTYTSISGGGGSGAPYFKNYSIPQNIIDSSIGGKIVLRSGAGGTGKASASSEGSSATDGTSGSESYIYVYDSSNVLKWGLKTPGGNGGKGASSTSGGTGGAQKAVNTCQMYNGTAWVNANCTGAGTKGGDGQKTAISDDTTASTGGAGGGSMYNSDNYSGGGTGGSASVVNGSKGSLWGSGGGGATVTFDADKNAIKGTGGNGQNGIAEIKYELVYQAPAGGGGGGGAFVKVRDMLITPSTTYTVRVGGGGDAGIVSSSGQNGGDSSITIGAFTLTAQGGKSGKIGSATTTNVTHGLGGDGGSANMSISYSGGSELHNGKAGSKGQNATDLSGNSWGGRGGESGAKIKGGCGGFYTNILFCSNSDINGLAVPFKEPENIGQTSEYGSAGAGGGGGGWSIDTTTYPTPGTGGKGQDGYVYIYWIRN